MSLSHKICHIHWTATIYWWLPVKTCCQNGCDIGWHRLRPPAVCRSLTSTEAFAASSSLALSTRPRECCIMQRSPNLSTAGVGGTTCCGSGRLLSSRADAVPDVHGRALRQEKGDDRRAVPGCCPRAARPEAAASQDLEESVEAAPVAAQVAPHRRQVAVARRHGDVVVSARGEMQQKWSSSVPLIFMFYLF